MEGLIPGRIVYFVFDARSVEAVRRQRVCASDNPSALGGITLPGNPVMLGEIAPAMVTAVYHEDTVNLKVLLDGPDVYWVTGVGYSAVSTSEPYPPPRSWHWMHDGQATRQAAAPIDNADLIARLDELKLRIDAHDPSGR